MASPDFPADPATILLIGSTGNGKSSLGNFLLHPQETRREKLPFKTATDNKPETQGVQVASDSSDNPTLCVIDTPGLNASGTEDIKHMIEVVRKLREVGRVTACILCIKFEAKIDTQYRETIGYYRNLLPSLFEGNVLIVLTNFATDKPSVARRKRQGIDVSKVIKNTVEEVMSGGFVSYEPQVFLIDSLPIDCDPLNPEESDQKISEDKRAAILGYIEATMIPVEVDTLKVAKTPALKKEDDKEIATLEGNIRTYISQLETTDKVVKEAHDKIGENEQGKYQIECELHRMQEEKDDKDTDDLVIAKTWSTKKEWKLFEPWQEEEFECQSPFPMRIRRFTTWDNGHLDWSYKEDDYTVKGTVKGHFFRGLYASGTIKTFKKEKYKQEIQQLCTDISNLEGELKTLENELSSYHGQLQLCSRVNTTLQGFISEQKESRDKLLPLYMTLEEAEARLSELLRSM